MSVTKITYQRQCFGDLVSNSRNRLIKDIGLLFTLSFQISLQLKQDLPPSDVSTSACWVYYVELMDENPQTLLHLYFFPSSTGNKFSII